MASEARHVRKQELEGDEEGDPPSSGEGNARKWV